MKPSTHTNATLKKMPKGQRTQMGASVSVPERSVHEFTVKDSSGKDVNLSIYQGKVLLLVNVASKCGFTESNYTQLTELYRKYKDQGFEILAFPCNQFLYQEPGTSQDAHDFACTRFQAEYPVFQKVRVNGQNAAPLYKFLKASKPTFLGSRIKWNFTKFLVSKDGIVIDRYGTMVTPLSIERRAIITQTMGYTSIYAITFVALVGALLGVSKAQPSGSCVSTLTTLSPCLGYITGNSTTPSQTCCSQLDSVIKSSPQCICSAVNSPIPNIGLNINRTQALQLPKACNIQAPPLSQCNVATGPTTPLGALSPVESPADKNPGVALTPTSSPGARSGVVVGARGGSKTIPSTGAGSSSGSVDRVPPRPCLICWTALISTGGSAVPETRKSNPWPGLWTHTFLHSASKVLEIHFQYGNLQIRTSSLDGYLLSCDYQDTSAISINYGNPRYHLLYISLAFFSVGVLKSCVLRVGIKCCKGCQTNAKRKLLSVSGVSAVEYNAEQGLLRVSGDPNPAKLLRKLAKWDKNAELVSLPGEVSAPAPRTPQLYQTKRMGKRTTKCFLLRCFGTKEKVEPYGVAGDENGSATPFINTVAPPMVYPPPQPTPGFATPIPYPPPCFGANQPPYTYTSGGMYQSPPPTFQLRKTQFPQMVNYPHH
ncbi:hypothetical protein HID58_031411 [Brassica napus]|uniref:Glutathione peroxidase n=2 Tax=Brassica TaxID=3705 RepID=A0ABQ8BTD5_BRANA|nr:hypothetical protein HID58_092506 [Brassica napus]KAH0908090.1 hypothetical protein HID58_031411 [Brassica napus]